jgi:transcriptional regulator with XRE-family HTH domain
MEHETLAERAWYAYHCLRRDESGEPPAYKDLEIAVGLSYGTLSHVMAGRRSKHRAETFPLMARALGVSEAWLRGDEDARGPTLTGMLPPRPGMKWRRHGDVPGWSEAVVLAKLEPRQVVPPAAFLAGADLPVFRPLDRITPPIAIAAAMYAYETSTKEEQTKYSTLEARMSSAGLASGKMRAAPLRRPAVK